MKFLIAPDKFKHSLSAREACQAIEAGIRSALYNAEITSQPMADGGEGSLEIIAEKLKLEKHLLETKDPIGRKIQGHYYTDHIIAYVELATVSGLGLLEGEERDPLITSTYGTGVLMADAISKGFKEIVLFLGGSSTNDGGMGIAKALGANFQDVHGEELKPIGANLGKVESITWPKSMNIEIALLCDVNNPLFGPNGAAHVYAAQKGADEKTVELLDEGLQHFAKTIKEHSGIDVSDIPGAGAAGGIAASLIGLFKAEIKSGSEAIAKYVDLEAQIQAADLVISGEGSLDKQSLQGKVVANIAKLCRKYEKRLVIFAGINKLTVEEEKLLGCEKIFSIIELANNETDAIQNASNYLTQCARTMSSEYSNLF